MLQRHLAESGAVGDALVHHLRRRKEFVGPRKREAASLHTLANSVFTAKSRAVLHGATRTPPKASAAMGKKSKKKRSAADVRMAETPSAPHSDPMEATEPATEDSRGPISRLEAMAAEGGYGG